METLSMAAFSALMTKNFRPPKHSKNVRNYLDDVFIQSQTKHEMIKVLNQYHQIVLKENMKTALEKSYFFFTRVKFLAHFFEGKTITQLE